MTDDDGLRVANLSLAYAVGGQAPLTVLDIDELHVSAGDTLGLSGASGSGKTSLLHVLAGIERADRGLVRWGTTDLAALPERARDRWRLANVGLVFQDFHLVPGLSILQNVLLPLRFDRARIDAAEQAHAQALIEAVGLGDKNRRIDVLSRGERQRAAIARALVRRPRILIADEPTASLDKENAQAIAALLADVATQAHATLIVASHDDAMLERLSRRLHLARGRLVPAP